MKVCIITLGCKVNQYESGQIAAKYIAEGHEITKNIKDAEICIINTCAVTGFAEKKSRYQAARIRRLNPNAEIIVCGCAVRVSDFYGSIEKPSGLACLKPFGACLNVTVDKKLNEAVCGYHSIQKRQKAYIKIQDGCNNFCSYCIVPHLRGRSRSRPLQDVLNEISAINKPIVLTGIDLSSYEFIEELCARIDKPFEMSSIEVGIITRDFLEILKTNKNFIPNFHVPLQSGSDRVLAAMNRKYKTAQYFEKAALIRTVFPNARITTDIICGFPTETDQEHNETMEFVKKVGFSHIHVFPYSRRTGTPAADLPQVQDSVITRRAKELAEVIEVINK